MMAGKEKGTIENCIKLVMMVNATFGSILSILL